MTHANCLCKTLLRILWFVELYNVFGPHLLHPHAAELSWTLLVVCLGEQFHQEKHSSCHFESFSILFGTVGAGADSYTEAQLGKSS